MVLGTTTLPAIDPDPHLMRYNLIMKEIHWRIELLDSALRAEFLPHGMANAEFCFLQLRKVCELIALGCLSAHGDLGKGVRSSLLKEWDVVKIMKGLEALEPDFYPVPIVTRSTESRFEIVDAEAQHILDKKILLRLYWRAGDVLHTGSLKRMFSQKSFDLTTEIADGLLRIKNLIRQHRILLLGPDRHLICQLLFSPKKGVQSFITYNKTDHQ